MAHRPTGLVLSTREHTPFTAGRFHLFCLPLLQHRDMLRLTDWCGAMSELTNE